MRSLARPLSVVALLGSIVWIVWYARSNPAVVATLRRVSAPHIVLLVLLVLGIFTTNGLYTKVVLSAYGRRLSLPEAFLLSVATTAANYVLPGRSGAALRSVYLKSRVGFALVDFFVTLSGLYVIALGVNGTLGLVSAMLLVISGRPFDPWATGLFAFAAAGAAALMTLPVPGSRRLSVVTRILDGWSRLRARPSLLGKLLTIAFAQSFVMLCQTAVAFHAIGVMPPLADVLFFTSMKSLALLVTITPGALGIVEWLSVYMATYLAFSPEQAFAAQALMRTITIGSALSIGPLAAFVLGHSHRRRQVPEPERR
jgi:uncharacterized membrane protein YbhN (UPF0104 family)